jgi:iron(III) transport system ATP-binding protein
VRLGGLRVRLPHRGQPVGPVVVAIRPEAIAVTAKGAGAIEGTVRKAAYLGAVIEYTIATGLGELFVIDRDAEVPLRPGDLAGVTLRERGVVILPRAR